MLIIKIFILLNIICSSSSLAFKNRVYFTNKNPEKDLERITHSQASFISKKWLEGMIIEVKNKEKHDNKLERLPSKLVELSEAHVVTSINQLENYISDHRDINDIYLSWLPRSNKNQKTPLFLIVGKLDTEKKIFTVKQLVQSPKWDPEQIPSCKLKDALIEYIDKTFQSSTIDLNYLYEHDLRYKLSWATWHLELEN